MTQLNNIFKNLDSDTVRFNEDKQVFTITHADGSIKTISRSKTLFLRTCYKPWKVRRMTLNNS